MARRGRKLIGDSRRIPITFTIETDIINAFKDHCRNTGLSASFFIQQKITEFLKEKKAEK